MKKNINTTQMTSTQLKRLLADGPMSMEEFEAKSGYNWSELMYKEIPLLENTGTPVMLKCFIVFDKDTVYCYRNLTDVFPPILKRLVTMEEVLHAEIADEDIQLFPPRIINNILADYWHDERPRGRRVTYADVVEYVNSLTGNVHAGGSWTGPAFSVLRQYGVADGVNVERYRLENGRRHGWMNRKARELGVSMSRETVASKAGVTVEKLDRILAGPENAFHDNAVFFANAFNIDTREILEAELGIRHAFLLQRDGDEPLYVEVRETDYGTGKVMIRAHSIERENGRVTGFSRQPVWTGVYPDELLRMHNKQQMEDYVKAELESTKKVNNK